MSRTFGGILFYGAGNVNLPLTQQGTGANQAAWTRNATGDWSLNNPNTTGTSALNFIAQLADVKRPYFTFPFAPGQGTVLTTNEFQEAFGTTPASPGGTGPGNPFSGGSLAFEGTPAFPWGLAVLDIFAVYSVSTLALTSATLALNRASYTENVAFTNTAIVVPTALATGTSGSASSPHVQKVTLAQPLTFESADFSDLTIELVLTPQATSAIRVYGLGAHVAVEYS